MPVIAERSQEVRSRILTAAAELFAEHGFAGASVDEIARRADVNKAMLYYHIGDKAELFATVLEGYLERVREALARVEAGTPDPEERIRKAQAAIFGIFQDDPTVPRIVVREMATGGEQIPDRALAKVGEIVGFTFRTVGEGREKGLFGDVNPFLVHAILVGTSALVVNSTKLRARLQRATGLPLSPLLGPAEIAGALGDVVLHGIKRPKKAGGKK
jgi:TetR/AcrR family transcriptional regulator